MTLTVRTPAALFDLETHAPLASGVAVIWDDAQGWGGIFEAQERAAELRAAVAGQTLVAELQTLDGRRATIALAPSEFVADGERPLTFRGQGEIDTAHYERLSR
ncbi:MAG: hypothetical protein IPO81_12095 [Kouleothrix sp.]|nr:hypothetical protein [Kouleothrix sp.]